MDENIRVNITLSPYIFKKLRNWAKIHGKTPSAYAGQIVSARIEANIEFIDKMLTDYAKTKNLSVSELSQLWDNDKD